MAIMENLLRLSLDRMSFDDLRLADRQLRDADPNDRLLHLRRMVRGALIDAGVRPSDRGCKVVRLFDAFTTR